MSICSKSDKWVMILLSITFILTDWRINNIALSDILLMIVIVMLIVKGSAGITKRQIVLYLGVLSLVLINITGNLFLNSQFDAIAGILGFLKVFYYMAIMIALYNFITDNDLSLNLFKILSITAVIVSIIGIYITLAIYLKGVIPYEFFWKFTRTDLNSYTYRGWGRSIIRTRSIFSEPAYLGFYLNTILGIFYFNKVQCEFDKRVEVLITITTLLTFSFSAILIMIAIKVIYYMNPKTIHAFFTNKRYILSLIIVSFVAIMMWETIEKTIIIRAQEILNGADGSGTARLQGSWAYINKEHIIMGNGIGNTLPIWNIYAYILSDLGLVSFIAFIVFNIVLFSTNLSMGMVFVMQGFQKGGYLGAGYWIFMLLIILCLDKRNLRKGIASDF